MVPLPPPLPGSAATLAPDRRAVLEAVLSCSAIGSPQTVRAQLQAFVERTQADEVMVTAQIFDAAARRHAYELLAQVMNAA